MKSENVRFSLELSSCANEVLEQIAEEMGCTKSTVLRRAIVLMMTVVKAQKEGRTVGVAKEGQELETRFLMV